MDTRNILAMRQRMRGALSPTLLAIIGVVLLLAIGAWFLIIKPHQDLVMADAGGHPSSPVSSSSTHTAAPPANVAAMDVNQLLVEARKAMNERRYLSPSNNNAFDFYLRVLQKQPGNRVAADALRETFPFAATSAEQAINSRDFNEAQRQIELLAKADPANFTLTILRSKLDAQRKTQDKQQAVDQQKTQQLAAQKAAADKLQADKLAEQQKAQLAEQQRASSTRAVAPASRQQQTAAAAAKPSADTASAGGGQSSDAVLVKGAEASYPPAALRSHQSGWVVVSFTIDPNGRTSDVRVVSSQPRRIFDRAAIEAVNRYRFTPAMKDGTAVASTREQKIEFNL
jgi:protein TonB